MNAGSKAMKDKALREYYANPSICKQCGKIIPVKEGQQPGVARRKKFCNHSCSAIYSNGIRECRYDWGEVQRFYDAGNNKAACMEHFGFHQGVFYNAARRGALKAQREKREIPLDKVMTENSTYNRAHLKARLLRLNLLENKCSICGLTEWHGKPLVMRLDHINGVPNDHRLENLRMVCPNCDSQLPTFSGRNIRKFRFK